MYRIVLVLPLVALAPFAETRSRTVEVRTGPFQPGIVPAPLQLVVDRLV
jgi:hypothetical protein